MRLAKPIAGVGAAALLIGLLPQGVQAGAKPETTVLGNGSIHHVLLISIDGMHAVDFATCSSGTSPTCPNLAALARTGTNYAEASTSRPSDSFPGLTALITGGSPVSTGTFYDVSYDRALAPPTMP